MKDKREFERQILNFKVNVTFSNQESTTLKLRDISPGGMYLTSHDTEKPFMGELLQIKLAENWGIDIIPVDHAVVVHKEKRGFGLSFIKNANDL